MQTSAAEQTDPRTGPGLAKAQPRAGTSYRRAFERTIQQAAGLTVQAKSSLALIASYADPDTGEIRALPYSFFAGQWGCTRRTVIRRFRRAEASGYLGIRRRVRKADRAAEPNTAQRRNRANLVQLLDGAGGSLILLPAVVADDTPAEAMAAEVRAEEHAAAEELPPNVREVFVLLSTLPAFRPVATVGLARDLDARRAHGLDERGRPAPKTLAQLLGTIDDVAKKCRGLPAEVMIGRLFSWLDRAKPVPDRVAVLDSLAARRSVRDLELESLADRVIQIQGEGQGLRARDLAGTLALLRRAAREAAPVADKKARRKLFLDVLRAGWKAAEPSPARVVPEQLDDRPRAYYPGRPGQRAGPS